MENLIYDFTHRINSAEADFKARLRPGALLNLLIQAAIGSADDLGFGFKNLNEKNLFWVLSRMSIQIDRPIMWNEKIEVFTWPKNIEKILYLRDFEIKDRSQDIVGRATSGWLAVDALSKRPKRVDSVEDNEFTLLKHKHALETLPLKLNPGEGESIGIRQPMYFDFDLNGHVTSTRYLDWMVDTFDLEFLEKNFPTEIHINYLKEVLPGEQVEIYRSKEENNIYNFHALNVSKQHNAFFGSIRFSPI
ncbi:MAG: thioesterase [Saprospiraceae bacterium]